jgi:hypothetical protein
MNQRNVTLSIVLLLALLVGAVYYFMPAKTPPSRFNWQEVTLSGDSYDPQSDQPYGTLVLWRLLNRYFPNHKVYEVTGKALESVLPLEKTGRSSYFFVGAGFYLDSMSQSHLLRYVAEGNTALISTRIMPTELFQELVDINVCTDGSVYEGHEFSQLNDTIARMHLLWPQAAPVMMQFVERNRAVNSAWEYLHYDFFCEEGGMEALGYLNDTVINFARVNYGEGQFLIHTTPVAFSNFHLLRPTAQQYATGVLAQFPEGDIYWDNANQVSKDRVARSNNNEDRPHPLAFILRYESLTWAWYLLLGLATTYMVFRSRRRQRDIPVLPKNENTSREFISQIARLHFRSNNYQWASVQMMRQFGQQIREKYGLNWAIDPQTHLIKVDEPLLQRLAEKSGVPLAEIQQLIAEYEELARFISSDQQLMQFYQRLEVFWARAK